MTDELKELLQYEAKQQEAWKWRRENKLTKKQFDAIVNYFGANVGAESYNEALARFLGY